MPTHKVKNGYKWGKSGKVYPTKKQADKQGQAIYANGWKEKKNIHEAFSPYKLLLIGIIRKTHDELCNKGYDENIINNYINDSNIQIIKGDNNFIFYFNNNPIFEIDSTFDLDDMLTQASNELIKWFSENKKTNECKKMNINEIGDTPKGQYAMGAVAGRKLMRDLKWHRGVQPETDKEHTNIVKKSINKQAEKGYPKEMKDEYMKGVKYGNEKAMYENKEKTFVKLTESELYAIIDESVRQILSELDWRTYASAEAKAANKRDNALSYPEERLYDNQKRKFERAKLDRQRKMYDGIDDTNYEKPQMYPDSEIENSNGTKTFNRLGYNQVNGKVRKLSQDKQIRGAANIARFKRGDQEYRQKGNGTNGWMDKIN